MLALITQTFHFLPQSRRSLAAKHRMRWRDDEEEEERGGEGRGGGDTQTEGERESLGYQKQENHRVLWRGLWIEARQWGDSAASRKEERRNKQQTNKRK